MSLMSGQEDPLKEKKATYSGILAWSSTWTEDPVGLQSVGLQGSNMHAPPPHT